MKNSKLFLLIIVHICIGNQLFSMFNNRCKVDKLFNNEAEVNVEAFEVQEYREKKMENFRKEVRSKITNKLFEQNRKKLEQARQEVEEDNQEVEEDNQEVEEDNQEVEEDNQEVEPKKSLLYRTQQNDNKTTLPTIIENIDENIEAARAKEFILGKSLIVLLALLNNPGITDSWYFYDNSTEKCSPLCDKDCKHDYIYSYYNKSIYDFLSIKKNGGKDCFEIFKNLLKPMVKQWHEIALEKFKNKYEQFDNKDDYFYLNNLQNFIYEFLLPTVCKEFTSRKQKDFIIFADLNKKIPFKDTLFKKVILKLFNEYLNEFIEKGIINLIN